MKRRDFFNNSVIGALGTGLLGSHYSDEIIELARKRKKAKNVIFMVSDGMSQATLSMGDILRQRKYGQPSPWMELYREGRVTRALMDMASLSSSVTDSAAASSSWGGGHRVMNHSINIGPKGEEYLPIWQKMKAAGKKVGCVTTVPITHATPAGFCVYTKNRSEQSVIADMYLDLRFDVMMGGGAKYFNNRKDKKDIFPDFLRRGFQVLRHRDEMMSCKDNNTPVLGVYTDEALPHEIDRLNEPSLLEQTPSLTEMAMKAIDLMQGHQRGFCLQVEGGRVDWAAHANDTAGLLYDRVAFDDCVEAVIKWAENDGNTLVIITSDHGNASPGLFYGDEADKNFESLFDYKHSNDWVLMGVKNTDTEKEIVERVRMAQGYILTQDEAKTIYSKYADQTSKGTYNAYKLPFTEYAQIQAQHTSVAYAGDHHTADYTELAMYGPGSEKLKPFMRNTDMHNFLLRATEVNV